MTWLLWRLAVLRDSSLFYSAIMTTYDFQLKQWRRQLFMSLRQRPIWQPSKKCPWKKIFSVWHVTGKFQLCTKKTVKKNRSEARKMRTIYFFWSILKCYTDFGNPRLLFSARKWVPPCVCLAAPLDSRRVKSCWYCNVPLSPLSSMTFRPHELTSPNTRHVCRSCRHVYVECLFTEFLNITNNV